MRQKRSPGEPRAGKLRDLRARKAERRAQAGAVPNGQQSLALTCLLAAAPKKAQKEFQRLVKAEDELPERALFGTHGRRPFERAALRTSASYAAGTIVNALPKSKAARRCKGIHRSFGLL